VRLAIIGLALFPLAAVAQPVALMTGGQPQGPTPVQRATESMVLDLTRTWQKVATENETYKDAVASYQKVGEAKMKELEETKTKSDKLAADDAAKIDKLTAENKNLAEVIKALQSKVHLLQRQPAQ